VVLQPHCGRSSAHAQPSPDVVSDVDVETHCMCYGLAVGCVPTSDNDSLRRCGPTREDSQRGKVGQ
jgi:hypothetical protein